MVTALRAHARAHLQVGHLSREPVTVGRYGGEPVLGRPFATDRLLALIDETFLGWMPPATPNGTLERARAVCLAEGPNDRYL